MDWRHLKAPAMSANEIRADRLETLPSHALVITKPRALLARGALGWSSPPKVGVPAQQRAPARSQGDDYSATSPPASEKLPKK